MDKEPAVQARMKNPAMVIPEALKAIQALIAAASTGGAPAKTLALDHLPGSRPAGGDKAAQ
jgi:hypothetical protein